MIHSNRMPPGPKPHWLLGDLPEFPLDPLGPLADCARTCCPLNRRMLPAELVRCESVIHVWRAPLDLQEKSYRRLEVTLSPDEGVRAANFRFESDKKRFVAARGILRDLLGRYLGESPGGIEFSYGSQGKPALQVRHAKRQIHFNLSHCQNLALFVFSWAGEVGVDVEVIRPDFAIEELAERFFSPKELAEFLALPIALRPKAFFFCWTRKEAYIKAKGAGLQIPIDSFSVSLTPGQPERLQSVDSSRWSLRSFEPAKGFVASVVMQGQDREFCTRVWQP